MAKAHPPPSAILNALSEPLRARCEILLVALLAVDDGLWARAYLGWWGIGLRHPVAGYVCGIFPKKDGEIQVGFELGVCLEDPEGLLTKGGAQFRSHPIGPEAPLTPGLLEGLQGLMAEGIRIGCDRRGSGA